jgi:hypothetical protein
LQIEQVEKLRKLLEAHPEKEIHQHDSDHITLCRFLKARKWDADKAIEMMNACAKWRSGGQPAPADPPFQPDELKQVRITANCDFSLSKRNI